jgi:hypothetical protein
LYWLGGVGETQLALEYVFTHKYNYDGVYWISGVNRATLFSGFLDIAKQTRCVRKPEDLNPEDVAKAM